MKQTIEIEVPNGKKAVWKDGKVVFGDIKPQLPKTWEEFYELYHIKEEYFIGAASNFYNTKVGRLPFSDRNVLPSLEAAKIHLALMQLHQLRDCYRQGWAPIVNKASFVIIRGAKDHLDLDEFMYSSRFLSFQSKEITKEFLNFKDLIEQASDLI